MGTMPKDPLAFLFNKNKPFVIAGPCALEDEGMAREVGTECRRVLKRLGVGYVFKASYDKANRSSLKSYRGPGLHRGLAMLERLKAFLKVPVLTDVHETGQVEAVARVADILQIPAFLCRQTDLLVAAAKSGRVVNIKKGQFVAPWNMAEAVAKVRQSGNRRILLTERGVSFGYNNLVVDFLALPEMKKLACPVIFDATHSVQLPGGLGHASGGRGEYVGLLARAAAAAGVDGYFFEVHPHPTKALSDGPNMLHLKDFAAVIKGVLAHDKLER